jgi:hypothetical protein
MWPTPIQAAKAGKKELKSTGYKSNKQLEKSQNVMAVRCRQSRPVRNIRHDVQ